MLSRTHSQKRLSPDEKRALIDHMHTEHGVSVRQGCEAVALPRSTYRYQERPRQDEPLIEALSEMVTRHPAIGFWQAHHRLRLAGHAWNHKRVYRVYTAMKLNIRRRARKRLPARVKQKLFVPEAANQVWSLDFMHDSLWNGRTYRLLNVIDDYNRQVLPTAKQWRIEADTSLPALRVIRVLEQLRESRGLPQMIRVDNGPEFISHKLDAWCKQHEITLAFIQPGEPTQNAYIERLNGSLRRELLDPYVFRTIDEVRSKAHEWQHDYNHRRPHKALGYRPPVAAPSTTPSL